MLSEAKVNDLSEKVSKIFLYADGLVRAGLGDRCRRSLILILAITAASEKVVGVMKAIPGVALSCSRSSAGSQSPRGRLLCSLPDLPLLFLPIVENTIKYRLGTGMTRDFFL